MTDLAYMVREDWAQHGTAMMSSSARIRDWLGDRPVLVAVTDLSKFTDSDRSADLEVANYIAPGSAKHDVINITNLTRVAESAVSAPVVVLHPFKQPDCEVLRTSIDSGALDRVFVLIWSPKDAQRAR